ncbi:pyrimidine 5'-nucleotidase [Sphingomonas daechungensis]|uniref:pyrimidine 5'-nucleotidase n=2 Tax=Sphingomonas daechungensis TaxID=1176646 RepID=UPI0031EFD0BD
MPASVSAEFSHIRDWIFDLDNCLYPAGSQLFELIDERMTAYIERLLGVDAIEARRVQKMHFHGSGTTLAGLMRDHDVDPHHFMGDVHDIPLDRLTRDDRLVTALSRLPGRKFIHTNGNAEYAWKVLDRLGIAAVVDHLHDIFAADLTPKPELHGYQKLLDQFGIDPTQAVMVEDMVRNLGPAKSLGMTTVWVDNGSERGNHGYDDAIVDVRVTDVGEWLESILKDDR